MTLNGEPVTFKVDTGCRLTIMNMKTFKEKVKKAPPLKKTRLMLRTYTKQKIKVLGKTYVKVNYKQREKILPIIVVKGTGPTLLGRWWLKHVKLDWAEIKHLAHHPQSLTLEQVHTANRLAKRAVRTVKERMKRMQGGNESLEAKVTRILFSYRITPHSTTGLYVAKARVCL